MTTTTTAKKKGWINVVNTITDRHPSILSIVIRSESIIDYRLDPSREIRRERGEKYMY